MFIVDILPLLNVNIYYFMQKNQQGNKKAAGIFVYKKIKNIISFFNTRPRKQLVRYNIFTSEH